MSGFPSGRRGGRYPLAYALWLVVAIQNVNQTREKQDAAHQSAQDP
jgi:hypothetical protein